MSYATLNDATQLYGEDYVLTSVVRIEGEPDTDSFTRALAKASSEIDSYLSTRYDVPIDPVPPLLVQYTVDIAIYRCSSAPGAGLSEEKRVRYDDALKWLRDVSKGVAGLGLDEPEDNHEHLPQLASTNEERLFSRTKLGDVW